MDHEPEEAQRKAHSHSQPIDDSSSSGEPNPSTESSESAASDETPDPASPHSPSDEPASSAVTSWQPQRRTDDGDSALTHDEEEDEGGGPVKSFLEHLEDLRWTLIRSVASLIIAMVVCLVAAKYVIALLEKPLERAQMLVDRPSTPLVVMEIGTNRWVMDLETNRFGFLDLGTNNRTKFVLSPFPAGTNVVLGLVPAPFNPEELPPAYQINLVNLGPVSPFVVALKIALFGGIGLASPFILLFVGQFVVPALHRKEKKYLYQAVAIGSLLFLSGVYFCYRFMLQIALNAAVQFSKWMNFGTDQWRAEEYIGFVVKFMLGMGLSFELPVVLLTLVKLDLLDYQKLNKFRPYWVVVNLVLAALLTPPDVVSQLLMAIPLQLLFEISVLIAWYWYRRDQKRLAREQAEAG